MSGVVAGCEEQHMSGCQLGEIFVTKRVMLLSTPPVICVTGKYF